MSRIAMIGFVMAGCVSPRGARVVRSVSVVGHSLVTESCKVTVKDDLSTGDCQTSAQPIPLLVVAALPPPPPRGAEVTFRVEREEVAAQLASVRTALDGCALHHAAGAALEIKLQIDGSGQVMSAETVTENVGLSACVASALTPVHFKVEPRALVFTFKPEAK
jgi:hypothetical protein